MVGDGNIDVPQETPANTSTDSATEKLRDEGRQGMPDLSRQQNDGSKSDTQIAGQFGSLQITGLEQNPSAVQKAEAAGVTAVLSDNPGEKPQQIADKKDDAADKKDAAVDNKDAAQTKPKTPEEKAAEASTNFEHKALDSLQAKHKDLKPTTDGSPSRAFDYQDNFTVNSEKSALDIAKDQLGPNASKDQLEHYADSLKNLNGKYDKTRDEAKFAAGSQIKLPGESADGGVVTRETGVTTTQWSDGSSLRVSETGSGSANFKNPDGTHSTVEWDPNNLRGTTESRTNATADNQWITTPDGRTVESKYVTTNARTGDGNFQATKITSSDDKGRTFVQEFDPPGSDMPKKITMTNTDKSQVELIKSREGFVSPDGKTAMTNDGDVYARKQEADGSVTRTYENGNTEKYDGKGHRVHSEGKDDWGRKVEYDYKPGENLPHTLKVTPHPGEKPVELTHHGNKYTADNLDAAGKKVGTVERGNDGRLIYTNDKEKSVHTELKDGTTFDKTQAADGTAKVAYNHGSESVVNDYDRRGKLTTETFTGSDGGKFIKNFSHDGKQMDSVRIEDKSGAKTELTYDEHAKAYTGKKTDASGKVTENVTLLEDKLVFTDVTNGHVRAEKYVPPTPDQAIPKLIPGTYDKDSGTFTYDKDGQKVVEAFATGRTDKVQADGSVEGSTTTGDRSTIKPNGEATVLHSDKTGVRLNADGTIDRWGQEAADNANHEKLSPKEQKFMMDHGALIDNRDLAEIHRRMAGDSQKLDSFYTSLEKLDTASNLTDAEKGALRKDIMHHVAFPAEIYQGRSPSCNVSVIERDMAVKTPDKYAETVVKAVSEKSLTTPDGKNVPLDPDNLKLADASGRDLASRIFQTATLQTEFYPRREFRNSEDGVGRLYPVPFKDSDKPATFEGLNLPSIADARYKMTGEQKAMTYVKNVDDLVAAYDANGGPPLIVAVNGSKPPFGEGGPVGAGGSLNHVVTITRIDKTSHPPKVYVENQWGLKADHSTQETAIDANKLMDNMRIRVPGHAMAGPGMVLSGGDHTKAYDVTGGKAVENKDLSKLVAKAQTALPGEKIM